MKVSFFSQNLMLVHRRKKQNKTKRVLVPDFFFLGGVDGGKRGMVPYPKGPIEKQKEVKNYLILF
jgi:hypothetical protein